MCGITVWFEVLVCFDSLSEWVSVERAKLTEAEPRFQQGHSIILYIIITKFLFVRSECIKCVNGLIREDNFIPNLI